MPPTLRSAIRLIERTSPAAASRKASMPDPKTVASVLKALEVVWRAVQGVLPHLQKWFHAALTEEESARYRDLAIRLPNVTSDERDELLRLTRRGLRLDRQAADVTEQEIPDEDLDVPAAP